MEQNNLSSDTPEEKNTFLNDFLANAGISSKSKADELIANGLVSVNDEVITQADFLVKKGDKVTFKGKPVLDPADDKGTRLNKYLASAGICSRRKADELIADGEVSVNGEVITQMGYRVKRKDKVTYNGKTIRRKKFTYILLNKPKNCLVTTEKGNITEIVTAKDGKEYERKIESVLDLIEGATKQRVFPVGKLDKKSTGLILLTSDGDLANKLAHPLSKIKQIFKVELQNNLTEENLEVIRNGIIAEDKFFENDDVSYMKDRRSDRYFKNKIGIKLNITKNNILKRIFNELDNKIVKMDRTSYCDLTKKNLPERHWRMLTAEEIINIKHLGDRGFNNFSSPEETSSSETTTNTEATSSSEEE